MVVKKLRSRPLTLLAGVTALLLVAFSGKTGQVSASISTGDEFSDIPEVKIVQDEGPRTTSRPYRDLGQSPPKATGPKPSHKVHVEFCTS